MNQDQQREIPKTPQKAAEEALSATFAMPFIRTMADDLLEASRGTPPVVQQVPVNGVTPQRNAEPNNAPEVFYGDPRKANIPIPQVRIGGVAKSQQQVKGNEVFLPETEKRKGVGLSLVVGVILALVICGGVWGSWLLWPRESGTIADKIPAEAVAFMNVSREKGVLQQVALDSFIGDFGLTKEKLGDSWNNIVYVALPGASPSEPIKMLLVDGQAPQTDNPNIVVKTLASGATALIEAAQSGRVDGLSNKPLGKTNDFRRLVGKLPQGNEYLYIRQGQVPTFLKSYVYLPIDVDYSTLITFASEMKQGTVAVYGMNNGPKKKVSNEQVVWQNMLKPVPVSVVAAAGHNNLEANVDEWRLGQSNNAKMQDFLNALNARSKTLTDLKNVTTGRYVAGSLRETIDGFAVIELKENSRETAVAGMNGLEEAFNKLGQLIGNASYADASFGETSYKDVTIRFVNFGDANHTFDYAVLDNLLVVSTSKDSMFELINTYQNQDQGASFMSLLAGLNAGAGQWQYVRLDSAATSKVPALWVTIFRPFAFLYIEPSSTPQAFSGIVAIP